MPTIDELNALALGQAMELLSTQTNARLVTLENEVLTLKGLVQKQNAVLGNVFQQMMGSGSTVRE